jgi:hypothetical protein
VHFVRGERVDEVAHARRGVLGVPRFGKARHHLAERVEGFARGLRVAVAHVGRREEAEQALVVVEVDAALEVIGVVDVLVVGVELDEAVGRRHRRGALVLLPVAVGDFELRLLREAPVGKARLELLEVLDRLVPLLACHAVLRLAVELLRRPADGLVGLLAGKDAAARQQERGEGTK